MDYKNKYLDYKQKYLELKEQIGGTRENILRLLSNMNDYATVNTPVLPINIIPPNDINSITWRIDINGNLYGYALTRDYNKLASDGGRQLLVTNLTVYPLLSQIGYELLQRIINYSRQNNYKYLLIEAPTNINKFSKKYYNDNNDNNYIVYNNEHI